MKAEHGFVVWLWVLIGRGLWWCVWVVGGGDQSRGSCGKAEAQHAPACVLRACVGGGGGAAVGLCVAGDTQHGVIRQSRVYAECSSPACREKGKRQQCLSPLCMSLHTHALWSGH